MNRLEPVLQQITKMLRSASVAQIGGFRPSRNFPTSWFGGNFVCLPDEDWPQYQTRAMLPLIQVRVDELPYVPIELDNIALLAVFIDPKIFAGEVNFKHRWLIRTYESLDHLHPLSDPTTNYLRPFPIKWFLENKDAPTWEDLWEIVNAIESEENISELLHIFHSHYRTQSGTKIGGWPNYIQGYIPEDGQFVFQVKSEPKANWMWGDNGTGYFFLDEEQRWKLHWQCY